jgi:hypothetical protein
MKTNLQLVLAAGTGLGGLGSAAMPASAMPPSGFDLALATPADTAKGFENIRWIRAPDGGCRWVPGWRRHGWGSRHGSGWGPVTAMAIGVQGAGGLMDMAGEVMATGIIGNSRLDRQR